MAKKDEARAQRLAEALRANLRKRKERAQGESGDVQMPQSKQD